MSLALDAGLTIRPATGEDGAFIERLGQEAFADFERDAGARTLGMTRERGAVTLIASIDGRRVGLAVVALRYDGTALLQAIAVRDGERGRGIGRRLLLAAERVAAKSGAEQLRLCTAQANVEALALFLKRGFRIERRMRRFYERGQDACALTKPL